MKPFVWDVDTRICFGSGQLDRIGTEAALLGRRALLVYGGGSIKRSGVYDRVCKSLAAAGVTHCELPGVTPNPRCADADRGAALCREQGAELVIAVGGGSSIDCAKAAAAAACCGVPSWELVAGRAPVTAALPLLAVPTLAATGSEMNTIAVISNPDTKEKIGMRAPALRPRTAIVDPTLPATAPPLQVASGAADIFAHALENYLGPEPAALQDALAEGLLRTVVRFGPIAAADPGCTEAQSELMWASCHAINGLLSLGKGHPWTAHTLEHQLSAFHDVTHGAGLAVLLPAWLTRTLDARTAPKLAQLGRRVFDLPPAGSEDAGARAAIAAMRRSFAALGLPDTLRGLGIASDETLPAMARQAASLLRPGGWTPLTADEILQIFRACF